MRLLKPDTRRWPRPTVPSLRRERAYYKLLTGATDYRLSMVDGTAFFEAEGLDLSSFVGKLLYLKDSANKVAYGYIKAAGGGEALGSELHISANAASDPNGNEADATTDWVGNYDTRESQGVEVDTGAFALHAINTTGSYFVIKQATVALGELCKLTVAIKVSAGTPTLKWSHGGSSWGPTLETGMSGDWANKTYYVTEPAGGTIIGFGFSYTGSFEAYIDNASIKKVTDCAVTGVQIVSTNDGGTQNWADIEAGFDPNDTTYTIVVQHAGACA